MVVDKKQFIQDYQAAAMHLFADDVSDLSSIQQYQALAFVVKGYMAEDWANTRHAYDQSGEKQVYYFSIEFLPGRLLPTNLVNLGVRDVVEAGLQQLGLDPAQLYESEPEPGLGNGGLGRLGSAFLDAMASTGMAGNGNGIRYQYGLFQQRFVDGYQVELPDEWLRDRNVWETRKDSRAVIIKYGGSVTLPTGSNGRLHPEYQHTEDVLAVPYDTPIAGFEDGVVNTMRLWSAEVVPHPDHPFTQAERERVHAITQILYPDDSNTAGRELRLRQEYFFVSAGLQSILRHYHRYHADIHQLPDYVAVHINDTHPTMAIPELMRLLLDEEGLAWEEAWRLTVATMSYTNHTLMQEALETWDTQLFAQTVPRLYQIVQEIDRRFRSHFVHQYGQLLVDRAAPLGDGRVRMAYLAALGSHAINGVAKLHTNLLKSSVLHDYATLFPARFNNKTNGITLRRWLLLANRPLTTVLDNNIGPSWHKQPLALRQLRRFDESEAVLAELNAAKHTNKVALAAYIAEELGIDVAPAALFDVQIKRLHAYKRQLLHLLGILASYRALKNGEDKQARVHIFAAKAAPSYYYAKEIIKVINAAAAMINADKGLDGKLKIVFLPNYGVSLAERIIPAADVSEQISLAGTEASGTSNMKLMANGAITLATLDGANIEIRDAVGATQIATFGLTEDEVKQHQVNQDYHARALYDAQPALRGAMDMLTDGSIPGIQTEGRDIANSLLTDNDEYFVLADFASYMAAQARIDALYQQPAEWAKVALANIAESGRFSADFTVGRYGREIWHVRPTKPVQE